MRELMRHWRAAAVTVILVLPSVLLLVSAAFDPRDLMTDAGATGPFAVQGGQLGAPVRGVRAGEMFGWQSTVCLKPGAGMLARTELRQSATGKVMEARSRRWLPNQRGCGPLPGMMRVPADTPPGGYRLCRVAILRPDGWWPISARLGCLDLEVWAADLGADAPAVAETRP